MGNMTNQAMIEQQILEVCRRFCIEGEYRGFELINNGHINCTYRVDFFRRGEIKDYIVQKINTYVFRDPIAMMENISSVTEFIRAKIKATGVSAKRKVLHYAKTSYNTYYTVLDDGSFWRCCRFIDDSVSFLHTDDLQVIEESGRAFGVFQRYLSEYPVEKLHIVIPHFHNTVNRFEALRTAVKENAAGRFEQVRDVFEAYERLEAMATKPYRLQREGVLPLRVTHNDTKTSNVLFDAQTHEYLSVIDLDTVMPGLVAFDFGDAIRIAASTAAEDEEDITKVALDWDKYEAFTRGFVRALAAFLTNDEKKTLALGALAMTTECGARFLTDYLNGDKYFRIHYPDHNLVRAKCQLALAEDMLTKIDDMQKIVDKYTQE